MSLDLKPAIGSLIRFYDGWEAEVTAHTERGFSCKGAAGRDSVPRLGYYSLGLEEIFTDSPEYKSGVWGFEVVKEPSVKVSLPKDPPPGLLMSMALRYDHSLGCPGYYDDEIYTCRGISHKQRLEGTLTIMRQLYEEVAGYGFYKPELEGKYSVQSRTILSKSTI